VIFESAVIILPLFTDPHHFLTVLRC